MREFYTGYFARIKKYKELSLYPVSIARFNPKGMSIFTWTAVAPAEDILRDYKSGKITEIEYDFRYRLQLQNRNILEDLYFIDSKIPKEYKGIVLCCYEKSGTFCHRHILAEYIDEKFSIPMKEINFE